MADDENPAASKRARYPAHDTEGLKKKFKPTISSHCQFVTIYAGKDDAAPKFIVYKEFAEYYSPVLKAAF